MKKYTIPFILAFTLGLILILLMGTSSSQALPNQPLGYPYFGDPYFGATGIYLSQQSERGIVSTSNQSIFGPLICDQLGDPFSPLNSRFNNLHPYPYRYIILIPPDYPSDILRVELFDPDAINSPVNSARVYRTQAALGVSSLPSFEDLSCSTGAVPQKWPCLIETDELTDYGPGGGEPVGGLSPDQVNPYWFLRVDENWGKNNGVCDTHYGSYTQNTMPQTLFELYYYKDNMDGTIERVGLASYVGQNGSEYPNHETDLHWVSPGAEVSFGWDKDSPGVDVPADPGSRTEHGFEINLSNEVPNMVTDSQTGNRYIILSVKTLNGSAENNFEIWAGPPDYVHSVPANVNDRNVYLLNNPSAHSSKGAMVFAMGNLPQNSFAHYPVEKPITYIPPNAAGESIYISMYDSDAGARPPITFYLDTIPKEDWSLTFADTSTTHDPDGVPTRDRCIPGSCNGKWTDPAYEIKLPNGTKDCDFSNPTPEACTPFYGGRLMASYRGAMQDTYGWQVSKSVGDPQHPNSYEGCDAFPITIHEGVRSVTPVGQGANPYPDAGDFDAPTNPRTYASFIYHQDNVPLLNATEGTVYKVQQGMGQGNFGWLVWNIGIAANSNTLGESLAWPGNTLDYTNHGDGGLILPGQSHVVRGYVEPDDSSDIELHLEDWIAASTGSINSSSNRAIIEEHISLGRVLRLPIWDQAIGYTPEIDPMFRASAFALFRIHGYSLSQGSGGSWILLEFIRFDASCGQNIVPLADVTLDGATFTAPNQDVLFDATIAPLTASQPVSYTWSTTDHAPITHSGNVSDTLSFNWVITGTKTITVTAENIGSTVTDTHTITVSDLAQGVDLTIIGTPQRVTPLPLQVGEPVEFAVTVKNLGYTNIMDPFFVDLFVNPSIINPDGIPLAESKGFIAVASLQGGASKTINITLADGLSFPSAPHQIYAMVDSGKNISEVEENNNVSSPLTLNAHHFIVPPTGVTIAGPTSSLLNEDAFFTANTLPVTTTQPISYTWEATDFAPIVQTNTTTDTITFNWATIGQKTITVTAVNAAGIVTDTHTITVSDLVQGTDLTIMGTPQLVTSLPIEEGEPVEFAVTVKNLGDTAVSQQSFINLYVNPNTIPATTNDGFNLLYDLDPGESKTINVTLANGLTIPDTPHQIYAMVDSDNEISEVDESNNISAPLSLDASNFAEKKFIYLPMIIKN